MQIKISTHGTEGFTCISRRYEQVKGYKANEELFLSTYFITLF